MIRLSGVWPKALAFRIAAARKVTLDLLVKKAACGFSGAQRVEQGARYAEIEIFAHLFERHGKDVRVVVEGDTVDNG